ncbi:hypothetical protein [Mycolicibacterium confluentis]|nr:hypothetical protein [Mycolicibacterium confluentis]
MAPSRYRVDRSGNVERYKQWLAHALPNLLLRPEVTQSQSN